MKMRRTGPDSVSSWLAALACTFVSMIIYAVVRLSGVLFVASMSRFNVDRQSASMPYILTDFIQAISCPLTGYLAHRFGLRLVMAFGCLLSAIGIAACFFAEKIGTVTVFWGIVFGVGFGLSVPLLAVMVTQHFVKKRAMAIGVVYFGGYVGFSVLPSISEYLIDYYGLSGTFLYISGLMLNCVPAALLLRKPTFSTEQSRTGRDLHDSPSMPVASKGYELHQSAICNSDIEKGQFETSEKDSKSRVNDGFELESNAEVDCIVNKDVSNVLEVNKLNETLKGDEKPSVVLLSCEPYITVLEQKDEYLQKHENVTETIKTISDDSLSISCKAVKQDEMAKNHENRNTNLTVKNSVDTNDPYKRSSPSLGAFKVFFEPVFIVVLITEAVFEGSFIAFVTIIVDFSMDVGLPLTDAKYVMLAFSVSSTFGLLGFGWVTDNGHMTLTNFSGLLFVFRCLSSALIPFSTGLPFLVVAVILQGVCEAPLSNLFPLIIADYYAKEVHEVAISCRLFLCAPLYLVTPYLIGYFRDDLGSYTYLFYLISLSSLLSGVLLFLAPYIVKFRCGREETILRNRSL